MQKLNIEDLEKITERVHKASLLSEGAGRAKITVHMGTCGIAAGAGKVKRALEEEFAKNNHQDVLLTTSGCAGMCCQEPMMTVELKDHDPVHYVGLSGENALQILAEHVEGGKIVEDFALGIGHERILGKSQHAQAVVEPTEESKGVPDLLDVGFFGHQTLVALKNRGMIDPEKIDEYIARGGYQALAKALTQMKPEDIVNHVSVSGLRGRGGGGFPAGRKWGSAAKATGRPKYIICNADEGDPGAYMDRSIIESDPHSVIEGMALAGYGVGSTIGYVYIRAEYPLATSILRTAIEQAREYGLLGENIFGTNFSFDVFIKQGAGAFVCGESSALRASIEGLPGEPTVKYDHATDKGLWEKPTVLNNVETFANVPVIIDKGGEWYASMGTEKSKGTKVFSLVGNIVNTGLIEVEMGTTLRKIIYEIGGGIPGGKQFKAVQTGGPSGGCLPADKLDMPVDFDQLKEAGSIMGSGGMIVMDESACIVNVAKYFIEFCNDESCGKCVSCRDGSAAMVEILERICNGEGREDDIELLDDLCHAITDASLCGLGTSLANPVLSTLQYFKDEYLSHIRDKKCLAKVCKPLFEYRVITDNCKKCGLCFKNCPSEAVIWKKKEVAEIIQEKCIKCGICKEVCKFDAVD
jgi:NADH:ubiquinone oxidoreductase subunit F (NADH-binding)/(2Fe-2S) ferredoxin/NAD-dependent dihydropyrimidine dehydrogenase PreA subunit